MSTRVTRPIIIFIMRARVLVLAAAGFALLTRLAWAHFTLIQPPSWLTTEDGGKGAPPCGEGTPSGIVTRVQGGHAITLKLIETLFHPGHYRVALSVNSRAELPPDPDVIADTNGISISAAIQAPPQIPVLADGLFAHTTADNLNFQTDLVLPNINCARCTLQVIEFMAEHGPNIGGGYFYHHCADLQIVADPALAPPDPAWIRISLRPSNTFLKPGDSLQFAATVAGTDNTNVVWQAAQGTISASGLYTAPQAAGTYTITAASSADSSKSASATVNVSAQDQKLYFAQFANGVQSNNSILSEITLFPATVGNAAWATIEMNDDSGNPLGVALNGSPTPGRYDVVIPANAAVTLKTNGQGPIQTGSVTVSSDARLSGVILFNGSIGLSSGPDSRPLKKFSAPVRGGPGTYTGIALMGLGQDQVVGFELRSQEGNLVAKTNVSLSGRAHLAKLLSQFSWDNSVDVSTFSGTLIARGTADMAATVILITPSGSAFLPVQEISP